MISKDLLDGVWVIQCDGDVGCAEEFRGTEDFKETAAAAKDSGWTAKKGALVWFNYCPSCSLKH